LKYLLTKCLVNFLVDKCCCHLMILVGFSYLPGYWECAKRILTLLTLYQICDSLQIIY